jgi:gas vesicle protein
MSERSSGETLLAFILGGIIGAALGVIYAPAAGKETRKRLNEVGDEIKEGLDDFVSDAKERFSVEKEKIESVIDAGKKAYEKK